MAEITAPRAVSESVQTDVVPYEGVTSKCTREIIPPAKAHSLLVTFPARFLSTIWRRRILLFRVLRFLRPILASFLRNPCAPWKAKVFLPRFLAPDRLRLPGRYRREYTSRRAS